MSSNKLDFEETELRLGLPGGARKNVHDDTCNVNGKRGFVDLKLNLSSDINNIKNSTHKTPAAKYVSLNFIFFYFSKKKKRSI